MDDMNDDSIDIPLEQLEEISPGVCRVKPTPAFLAWVKRQKEICFCGKPDCPKCVADGFVDPLLKDK
jgi:hypothetical protein